MRKDDAQNESGAELEVWRVDLARADDEVRALRRDLSPPERDRSARLVSRDRRRRFEVARAALRQVLSARLGVPAHRVPIAAAPGAKPRLELEDSALSFNLSHSGEIALIAVAAGREVGVDVEVLRPLARLESLAARVLSERERSVLREQAEAERPRAFMLAWTRKEAVLKALGEGLAGDVAGVEVSIGASEPVRLLAVAGAAEAALRWRLEDVDVGSRHVAALAYDGPEAPWRLRTWRPARR